MSRRRQVQKRGQPRGTPQVTDAQQGLETVADVRLAALAGTCLDALRDHDKSL